MSAQPIPFPPREPTYAQLRAQIAVYRAEFEVMRNTPAAILIAAMRKIITEADEGCRDSGNPKRDADRLAALFSIRHVALDALSAVRMSERGPIGNEPPCG